MSIKNSPYDGDFCKQKEIWFDSWAATVEFCAENKINHVFFSSDESFSGCPHDETEIFHCNRYIQYIAAKQKQK